MKVTVTVGGGDDDDGDDDLDRVDTSTVTVEGGRPRGVLEKGSSFSMFPWTDTSCVLLSFLVPKL